MTLGGSHRTHAQVNTAGGPAVLWFLLVAAAFAIGQASAAHAASSPTTPPSVHVAVFDRFVRDSGPVCRFDPARRCVALAWRLADADGDGGLSLSELRWIRTALRDWVVWRDDLTRTENAAIAAGLLLAEMVGIERLHRLHDLDGDGRVAPDELLADVALDGRPIGEILLDPASLDHQALARKLGLPQALVDRIPSLVQGTR